MRLLAGLSKDQRVGRAVRRRLLVALAYNAQPVNLIPDFVPVIGLADNVVGYGVGGAQRHPQVGSGRGALCNWSGSRAGFALLCRLNISHEETGEQELRGNKAG